MEQISLFHGRLMDGHRANFVKSGCIYKESIIFKNLQRLIQSKIGLNYEPWKQTPWKNG